AAAPHCRAPPSRVRALRPRPLPRRLRGGALLELAGGGTAPRRGPPRSGGAGALRSHVRASRPRPGPATFRGTPAPPGHPHAGAVEGRGLPRAPRRSSASAPTPPSAGRGLELRLHADPPPPPPAP